MTENVIPVTTYNADGSVTHSIFIMPPELVESLERVRAEWDRLKEAGTPYWCIHDDRQVDHPRAYWREDRPDDPIHRKHGVFCRDCGGYIQEG